MTQIELTEEQTSTPASATGHVAASTTTGTLFRLVPVANDRSDEWTRDQKDAAIAAMDWSDERFDQAWSSPSVPADEVESALLEAANQ